MLMKMLGDLANITLGFVMYMFLARVLLQLCSTDRYNPIAMSVTRLTDPVLAPLRRVLPKLARWDLAAVIVLFIVATVRTAITTGAGLAAFASIGIIIYVVFTLLQVVIDLYVLLIFIMVILSFVAPGSYHPGAVLVRQLTDPLLNPIQRLVPAVGGLDFSPMIALVSLYMLRTYLLPALASALLA